jgi:hypothetical protein
MAHAGTFKIEGTPEQLAAWLERLPNGKRYRLEEVEDHQEAKQSMPVPSDTPARVTNLLREWQREDNTPVMQTPLNDGTMTPSEALFRKWAAEDSLLTPEEAKAEEQFWDSYVKEHEKVAI